MIDLSTTSNFPVAYIKEISSGHHIAYVMVSPVPAGTPLAAGAGGVGIWNANDVYIWTDYIIKYLCIEAPNKDLFHASEFALSDTMKALKSTYTDDGKKEKAIIDVTEDYHILVEHCLNELAGRTVLENTNIKDSEDDKDYSVYRKTKVLRAICPEIKADPNKMHDVDRLLKKYK